MTGDGDNVTTAPSEGLWPPFSHSAPRPMLRFPLSSIGNAKRSRSVFPILWKALSSRCAPTLSLQRLPCSAQRSWFSTAPSCLVLFSTALGASPPRTRIWRRTVAAVANFWRIGGDSLIEPCARGAKPWRIAVEQGRIPCSSGIFPHFIHTGKAPNSPLRRPLNLTQTMNPAKKACVGAGQSGPRAK